MAPRSAIVAVRELHGEAVECIDFYEQPGVRSLLKQGVAREALRSTPPPVPERAVKAATVEKAAAIEGPALQEPCPDGSVPLRRPTTDEILAFGSLGAYLNKAPPAVDTHEYATVRQQGINNWGGEAWLNVWSPGGVTSNDFSLSQIWVMGGSGAGLQSVEAGWIKNPNSNSRLFIFFTANSYGSGSCWNADCGFVQTDPSVTLNGLFSWYSGSGGNQAEAFYHIQKTGDTGDYWFGIGSKWVGYWPRSLFNNGAIANHATTLIWGGEVFDATGSSHTTADMGGDGSFAASGFGHAAWQRTLRYHVNNAQNWGDASLTSGVVTNSNCYSLRNLWDGTWFRHIYFGGPGYSMTACPL